MALNLFSFPDVQALCCCLLYYLVTLKGISQRGDWPFSRAEELGTGFCLRGATLPCLGLAPHVLKARHSPSEAHQGSTKFYLFASTKNMTLGVYNINLFPKRYLISLFTLSSVFLQCLHFCVHLLDCKPFRAEQFFIFVLHAASNVFWIANQYFGQQQQRAITHAPQFHAGWEWHLRTRSSWAGDSLKTGLCAVGKGTTILMQILRTASSIHRYAYGKFCSQVPKFLVTSKTGDRPF